MSRKSKTEKLKWDRERIQALRQHLNLTQRQLADRLGTRQQTVSEWENGLYLPRGASAMLLSMVAETAEFKYDSAPPPQAPPTP